MSERRIAIAISSMKPWKYPEVPSNVRLVYLGDFLGRKYILFYLASAKEEQEDRHSENSVKTTSPIRAFL